MATALTPAKRSNFLAKDNGSIIQAVKIIITIDRSGPDTFNLNKRYLV